MATTVRSCVCSSTVSSRCVWTPSTIRPAAARYVRTVGCVGMVSKICLCRLEQIASLKYTMYIFCIFVQLYLSLYLMSTRMKTPQNTKPFCVKRRKSTCKHNMESMPIFFMTSSAYSLMADFSTVSKIYFRIKYLA